MRFRIGSFGGRRDIRALACVAAAWAAAAAPVRGQEPASPSPVTIERAPSTGSVTIGAGPPSGTVTASRASDAPGNPVDISAPVSASGNSRGTGRRRMDRAASGGGFGLRVHPIYGTLRAHTGVDLAARSGAPIIASTAGVVRSAGWLGGYGLCVTIDHGRGVHTRYAHLSRISVAAGQSVRPGQVIGLVGSTGVSTGPHLHYEVRVNGAPVNPVPRGGR